MEVLHNNAAAYELKHFKNIFDGLTSDDFENKITKDLIQDLKNKNIVIAYCESDDLCKIRGAMDDDVYCYSGCDLIIQPSTKSFMTLDNICIACEFFVEKSVSFPHLIVKKHTENMTFDIDISDFIPHEHFIIYDEPESIYFKGLLFYTSDFNRCLETPPELKWREFDINKTPKNGSLVLMKNKKYRYPVTATADIYWADDKNTIKVCQWTVLDGYGNMHGAFPARAGDLWFPLIKGENDERDQ